MGLDKTCVYLCMYLKRDSKIVLTIYNEHMNCVKNFCNKYHSYITVDVRALDR